MAIESKFIENPIERHKVMKFLEGELDRAGVANIEIQRTPVVTRIAIEVLNPGRVIGKKGKTINMLTETLKAKFRLENPQISVVEVRNPTIEPALVAKKAAKYIEMGKKVRAVLHFLIKDIIRNGALGAEIVASGKIGAKGARSKSLRVAQGYIPKSGEPARLVRQAHVSANTKSGIIGVLVRIAPPGTVFPDKPSTQVAAGEKEGKKGGENNNGQAAPKKEEKNAGTGAGEKEQASPAKKPEKTQNPKPKTEGGEAA